MVYTENTNTYLLWLCPSHTRIHTHTHNQQKFNFNSTGTKFSYSLSSSHSGWQSEMLKDCFSWLPTIFCVVFNFNLEKKTYTRHLKKSKHNIHTLHEKETTPGRGWGDKRKGNVLTGRNIEFSGSLNFYIYTKKQQELQQQ